MKKIIILIALAVNFSFASAAGLSVKSNKESSVAVFAKGGDDDLKSRIKAVKQRRKALREEEKVLDQKLKIKKLERQAKAHEKRNKHKQVEIDHQ